MAFDVTTLIRQKEELSFWKKVGVACRLSLPAMLAQLTSIAMQYIDSAMVGSLGAGASAAIGLVSSSIWLMGGILFAAIYGYTVQIAQSVGADDTLLSEKIFRLGLLYNLLLSVIMAAVCAAISGSLPVWLGGNAGIVPDASRYFLITAAAQPISHLGYYAGSSIQATGNMKTPAILESLMCVLDVVFNTLLIFPSGERQFFGLRFYCPGAGLGVTGAALGTMLAEAVIGLIMLAIAVFSTRYLKIHRNHKTGFGRDIFVKAFKISLPAALQQAAISGAMVLTTHIVAPLGTVAIAANSFAITVESVCYMPGFGLQGAASTLVGQSIGAQKTTQAKNFAWITTILGMIIMGILGLFLISVCPHIFAFLTPDLAVQQLGVKVLRTELLAEPFYGASIVATGALRGAGDTLVPGILSFVSIWGVRVTLAFLLVDSFGLYGVWIAMAVELTFRGIVFLLRLKFGKWQKRL